MKIAIKSQKSDTRMKRIKFFVLAAPTFFRAIQTNRNIRGALKENQYGILAGIGS